MRVPGHVFEFLGRMNPPSGKHSVTRDAHASGVFERALAEDADRRTVEGMGPAGFQLVVDARTSNRQRRSHAHCSQSVAGSDCDHDERGRARVFLVVAPAPCVAVCSLRCGGDALEVQSPRLMSSTGVGRSEPGVGNPQRQVGTWWLVTICFGLSAAVARHWSVLTGCRDSKRNPRNAICPGGYQCLTGLAGRQ